MFKIYLKNKNYFVENMSDKIDYNCKPSSNCNSKTQFHKIETFLLIYLFLCHALSNVKTDGPILNRLKSGFKHRILFIRH